MRYLGGKGRLAKRIAAILGAMRAPGQTYLEPFCGGCHVLAEMAAPRIAADISEPLISLMTAVRDGWTPPDSVSEEEYARLMADGDPQNPMTGFVGFGCSFAGKLWGGYARGEGRNYAKEASRALSGMAEKLREVHFLVSDFRNLDPDGMLIYCDPPYRESTSYSGCGDFDSDEFWATARTWSTRNTVVISEYAAPDDFDCIWEFGQRAGLRPKAKPRGTERLFMPRGSRMPMDSESTMCYG